ncbi:helix-turn-helix transcriptional regulator [Helicobacter sp. 13S00401-1]|uniref:helix-turn-helix domain-containing protein n=1 Tax=Helicobacter sp. 13S00401-1 TaxID=1905758 RepID=UPI000BA61FA0|nr:helix-turn-helix transcriptional regulator [Helicobacter sp. 13S00401-1]
MQDVGYIKEVCMRLDITQKELALKIGVSQSIIGQWSRGATPLPRMGYKNV